MTAEEQFRLVNCRVMVPAPPEVLVGSVPVGYPDRLDALRSDQHPSSPAHRIIIAPSGAVLWPRYPVNQYNGQDVVLYIDDKSQYMLNAVLLSSNDPAVVALLRVANSPAVASAVNSVLLPYDKKHVLYVEVPRTGVVLGLLPIMTPSLAIDLLTAALKLTVCLWRYGRVYTTYAPVGIAYTLQADGLMQIVFNDTTSIHPVGEVLDHNQYAYAPPEAGTFEGTTEAAVVWQLGVFFISLFEAVSPLAVNPLQRVRGDVGALGRKSLEFQVESQQFSELFHGIELVGTGRVDLGVLLKAMLDPNPYARPTLEYLYMSMVLVL